MRKQQKLNQSGFIMPTILSFIIAALIFIGACAEIIQNNLSIVGNNVKSQEAFNIAEAGVNYYLWHLSHNGTDYKDGQTTPATQDPLKGYGPYVHTYVDDNAVAEGTYTLWIKPHGNGSTLVDVRSEGRVTGTNLVRTVQAEIGATSFGNYAVVSDGALWFGATETANGPVFSNVGVRMDGTSNDTVSSANASYYPSYQVGGAPAGNVSHPGVWCDTSVTSPVDCTTRDKSNWIYPTASVDFNQVTSSLCTMKKISFAADSSTASLAGQANACSQTPVTRTAAYLPQRSSSANSSRGYMIQLNPNGTYDLFTVNNVNDTKATYSAALNMASVATGITIPSSGVIFAEDNVWVRSNPTFHGRVTIAAGRLATANKANISVIDNLAYSAKDGSDAIGLVAEDSVYIAPYAAPATGSFTLEVDAAMLAQSGDVEFPSNYTFSNTRQTRGWINSDQRLNFYGSVATRQTWTWSWESSSGGGDMVYDSASKLYYSGFKYSTTQFDYNLRYAPPPSYPTTGGYSILVWREVLTKP